MKKGSKLISILLILVLTIISLVFYSPGGVYAAEKSVVSSYVAKVGTVEISKEEYGFLLIDIAKRLQIDLRNIMSDLSTINKMTPVEYVKQVALNSAVELKIQLIKAKSAKISLTKKELDDLNKNIDIAVQNFAATAEEQEKALIIETGLNIVQLKSVYKDIFLVQKFATFTQNSYKYTDTDLKKYYNANKDELNKVTVGQILFRTAGPYSQPLAQDKQDLAKKKAYDILLKVKSKGNFAALAKQYSEDTDTKNSGGTITLSKNGLYAAEFENWAFDPTRKVGNIGIIKTSYGYHVMKLYKIFSYDEIKNDIKSSYTSNKYKNELEVWKKDKKFVVVKNKIVYDAINLQSLNTQPESSQDPELERIRSFSQTNIEVVSFLGKWIDINSPEHFISITKSDKEYQFEDNDGKYPAIFKDGRLIIQISNDDTAEVYYDSASIHIFTVYQEGITEYKKADNSASINKSDHPSVEILMTDGEKMVFTLYPEFAPETVTNFLKLAKAGFYNGLTFHRIIAGFMIQGGDPTGDGTGGSKDTIKGEFSSNGFTQNTLSHKRGVISMARSQDMNSASSQFFIMDADYTQLDGQYAAFGMITEGEKTLTAIANTPVDVNPITGESSTPKKDVVIKTITVLNE
jgi:foldase protein PrsA